MLERGLGSILDDIIIQGVGTFTPPAYINDPEFTTVWARDEAPTVNSFVFAGGRQVVVTGVEPKDADTVWVTCRQRTHLD